MKRCSVSSRIKTWLSRYREGVVSGDTLLVSGDTLLISVTYGTHYDRAPKTQPYSTRLTESPAIHLHLLCASRGSVRSLFVVRLFRSQSTHSARQETSPPRPSAFPFPIQSRTRLREPSSKPLPKTIFFSPNSPFSVRIISVIRGPSQITSRRTNTSLIPLITPVQTTPPANPPNRADFQKTIQPFIFPLDLFPQSGILLNT